jgi:hypothetical protein
MIQAVRSQKTKQDFIKYMEEHPSERFWQAASNFSGYSFIIASDILPDSPNQLDTFYWEEKNHPTPKDKK